MSYTVSSAPIENSERFSTHPEPFLHSLSSPFDRLDTYRTHSLLIYCLVTPHELGLVEVEWLVLDSLVPRNDSVSLSSLRQRHSYPLCIRIVLESCEDVRCGGEGGGEGELSIESGESGEDDDCTGGKGAVGILDRFAGGSVGSLTGVALASTLLPRRSAEEFLDFTCWSF